MQELRVEAHLTQKQLAEMLSVSTSTVGSYEANINEPSIEIIRWYADKFQVSVDYLVQRTKIRTPPDILNEALSPQYGFMLEKFNLLNTNDKLLVERLIDGLLLLEKKQVRE